MQITIDIPDALAQDIQRLAKTRGITIDSVFAEAAEDYLQTLKREEAFRELENFIGTPVASDFETHLSDLRRDDPNR